MQFIRFAFTILFFLSVICGAHYFLYTSSIRFFSISDPMHKKILFRLMTFLALSFLPSAILLRTNNTIFTSLYYIIAGTWLGLAVYFLFAAVVIWIIFGAGKLIGTIPDMRMISIVCVIIACLTTAYGVWRAQYPEIKNIDIKIERLPAVWQGKTIVQLSDVHLGSINRVGFMKRIAEKVNRVNPYLILITGDLFDGMGGDLPSFIEPLNALKASKGIFFVTGNHEGYLKLTEPVSVIKKTNIRILNNEVVDIDGLQIAGISFPEHNLKNNVRSMLETSAVFDPARPNILMYHMPTNISDQYNNRAEQQTRTYWHPDTSMSLAKEMGIDLQLSGHTHNGQFFPFNLLTHYIYNGFDYGLHKDGSFQIFISRGAGTWGPPMRVGCPPEIVVINLR
ncbi:MAG: metallophosphoesterase [Desulfobacterales bacterium]|nr:metallophosphoesterase [Desulfobacterales bacterium]